MEEIVHVVSCRAFLAAALGLMIFKKASGRYYLWRPRRA